LIEFIPETGSTNADVAARLRSGEPLPEGYWRVADRQTSGRGRQGREWQGRDGNFMGSTFVRVHEGDPPPQTLALVAGLAAFEALHPHCDQHALRLKWPNDVLLDGRKLAGILLEAEGDAVVVGIGANLVSAPRRAGRRAAALPKPVLRDAFAQALAWRFAEELDRWRTFGVDQLLERWAEFAHPLGEPLTVHEPDGAAISGTFAGLDEGGALLLRLADGSQRVIHAGDVMLESE
jgi:BirA family transcriptional regulator, biotin operon repressor / biotin---[acetyl-CoA-carboxylase] ligase